MQRSIASWDGAWPTPKVGDQVVFRSRGQEVIMQHLDRMVHELERDGRTVYCSSFVAVAALLAMGWRLVGANHGAELERGLAAAGSSPSTHDPSEQSR